jgi:hypothetical protein
MVADNAAIDGVLDLLGEGEHWDHTNGPTLGLR